MRFHSLVIGLVTIVAPSMVYAQYDYDDFMTAVQSGQSKQAAPSLEMPRLAQLPDGSGAAVDGMPPIEPVPSPAPSHAAPMPQPIQVPAPPTQINFDELFQQQDFGLADPLTKSSCGCAQAAGHSCDRVGYVDECPVMPYQVPRLPAPASLRGYFQSSPCIANVWDGYSCEAAAQCAKRQSHLLGSQGCSSGSCQSCKTRCD